jgi:hypothetical protein
MFGKAPRSNTKLETLQAKIAEETEKRAAAKAEEDKVEEPIKEASDGAVYSAPGETADEEEAEDPYGEEKATMSEEQLQKAETDGVVHEPEIVDLGMYGGPMAEDAGKIADFTDKEEFKAWAVDTFKKHAGKASKEHIEEFQAACNSHFEKIG